MLIDCYVDIYLYVKRLSCFILRKFRSSAFSVQPATTASHSSRVLFHIGDNLRPLALLALHRVFFRVLDKNVADFLSGIKSELTPNKSQGDEKFTSALPTCKHPLHPSRLPTLFFVLLQNVT